MKPEELVKQIARDSIRVHAPTSVIFLCGGIVKPEDEVAVTKRDAFQKIVKLGALAEHQIVLAEDAKPLTMDAEYTDLLKFESDIAQVVSLILLFVESPGSLAELGAFAALKTVAPSLLAVVEDHYYNQVSFVRDGPVRHLEADYGDEWVLVIDRAELGIDDKGGLAGLDLSAFSQSVLPVVESRLEALNKSQKFDPDNSGHAMKLIAGLCQEFGAMKITEIKLCLEHFGVNEIRMQNFLYCIHTLGWVKKVKKGNNTYYTAMPVGRAIEFSFQDEVEIRDKIRWRSDIREYWKKNDRPRMRAIIEGEGGQE